MYVCGGGSGEMVFYNTGQLMVQIMAKTGGQYQNA